MSIIDFEPFDGDGRRKVYPPAVRPIQAGKPTAVTNGTARNLISMFQEQKESNHSGAMTTLWVLIAWCQHQKKPFEVWRWDMGTLSCYSIFLGEIPPTLSREGAIKVLSS